ncbi:class I SAM-dependent methyltransferase [Luteipulveratus flavus]|uniref:Class I SAM-dependent methyltransferase n=1 Tax=Luteipulveratus flavus TaxID=3031728 RepID=A0ABT6C2X4_9MICO|nr:class I SAM-dependent methyltransferase [Luteipulveratus sp. YIM 133296]MDF8263123.1 class I SAM-dependent methyltransferase [Luteipulveratus sp. YIM 133296]
MSTAEDLADRIAGACVQMMDVLSIALGDRLGFYRALAAEPGRTVSELAAATGTSERYVREWLEQQAVTGFVVIDDSAACADRRHTLAEGAAEVLTDADSLLFLAPLARQLAAAARMVPAIGDAVTSGGGVPWAAYGTDMRESEADLNRPAYLHLLATEWLPALPDVVERLRAGGRVADVGCGAGWSSIALAHGFPESHVDAFDLDEASVALARSNVAAAGLSERVEVRHVDIGQVPAATSYDLVTAFECLHDLPHPVEALRAVRALASPDGVVLVGDMKVAEELTAPGDDVERMMYGFSILVCLPDSMATPGSAATGTVMRPQTLRRYATDAGFTQVEVLPVEHDTWRFYRLTP